MGGDVCGLPADDRGGLSGPRRVLSVLAVAACWLLADQATKALVVREFQVSGLHRTVIPGWLDLTLTYNTGAAFGLLNRTGGARYVFILISSAVLLGAFVFWRKLVELPAVPRYALALVAAGAAGNLVDRLLRGGQVVDFIHFHIARIGFIWPDFNVADIGVTCGMTVYVCYVLWTDLRQQREQSAERAA